VPTSSLIRNWLQLIRVPNLFTVPGDPLLGIMLVSWGHGADLISGTGVVVTSILLYIGGLIQNDISDIEHDKKTRPERPLPSGNISLGSAKTVCALCFLLSLIITSLIGWLTLVTTVLLIASIIGYNNFLKETPVLGPILMGCCRMLNVILGISLFWDNNLSKTVLICAGIVGLYIFAVTELARGEENIKKRSPLVYAAPFLASLIGFIFLLQYDLGRFSGLLAMLSMLEVVIFSLLIAIVLIRKGQIKSLPKVIGMLIGNLIFLQAAFIFSSGAVIGGLVILGCWIANRLLARTFYAS